MRCARTSFFYRGIRAYFIFHILTRKLTSPRNNDTVNGIGNSVENDCGGTSVKAMNKKTVKEWCEAVIIAGVIACVLYFICWPMEVDGRSMENTFSSGDRVLISRLWVRAILPVRGEIVLCDIAGADGDIPIIKRVIGLPKDHIVIKNGALYINGAEISEPYIKDSYTNETVDVTLGADEYFVMGDNRLLSSDSRTLGAVSIDKITAKVFFRFYPFERAGGL
jgi:signal peptidase I